MLGMWYVLNTLDAIFVTEFITATMLSTGYLVTPPRITQYRCNMTCHFDTDPGLTIL